MLHPAAVLDLCACGCGQQVVLELSSTELEEAGLIADPDLRQEFRARIQSRFAELNQQQRSLTQQRDALSQPGPLTGHPQTPELLDRLPRLTTSLGTVPGDPQRNLYDA